MTIVHGPTAGADPLVLWVFDPSDAANEPPPDDAPRPRSPTMPGGAFACTVDEALVWTHEGLPPPLAARWLTGVLVQTAPDAPALVRRAARALRERLALRDRTAQLEVAAAWGEPAVVAAALRLTSRRAPTLADMARALARVDHPEATELARMCWALEQL